ncbi:MAG: type II toxin-antitoxin system RelE/ParE family toxin [Acidimicrobiales bacterium]
MFSTNCARNADPCFADAWVCLLEHVQAAAELRIPPGNRLEKLEGDRASNYIIRVNDQWRICFRWTNAGPEDVVIVDYH